MDAGQDRKPTINAARRVPVEQIQEVLRPDNDLVDRFLVYNRDLECSCICCWSRTNGMMATLIEDGALAMACIDYMKGHDYLAFESMDEAVAHVKAQGWSYSRG